MRTQSLAVFGLLIVLLSGCVSVGYEHQLDRDGSSLIIQKIALSSTMMDYISSSGGSDSDLAAVCENMTTSEPDVNCTYSDGVFTLTKEVPSNNTLYAFTKTSEFPYAVYTLEVRKLPELVESETEAIGSDALGEESTSDFKDPSSKSGAASMKSMGASISYTVVMPGELVSAENGEIEQVGNVKVARYDVLKLMEDGEYIAVKSRELDLVMVGAAVAGIVLLLGAIIVAFVLFKASRK